MLEMSLNPLDFWHGWLKIFLNDNETSSARAPGNLKLLLTFSPAWPEGPGSPVGPARPLGPSGPSSPLGPTWPTSPWKTEEHSYNLKYIGDWIIEIIVYQKVIFSNSSFVDSFFYLGQRGVKIFDFINLSISK